MTHVNVSTPAFMSGSLQADGPDEMNFVNMDSLEMFLELKNAADAKSNER